jgi:hypothetical protein
MKNIFNTVRRWISGLFRSRNRKCREDFIAVMIRLDDIVDLLDIIAQELARWADSKPRK